MGGRVKGTGGKGFVMADWQVAYNIAYNNGLVAYLESEPTDGDYKEYHPILPSDNNQERELIKKDLIQNLSKEAKDIIALLFKSPAEVLKDLMPAKYKGTSCEAGEKFSKEQIKKKLISEGWQTKKINNTFLELQLLVRELEMVG